MNPQVRYTFRSRTRKETNVVTIKTRMGEDSARSAAMEFFWGPPNGVWCFNKGLGLNLIEKKLAEEPV